MACKIKQGEGKACKIKQSGANDEWKLYNSRILSININESNLSLKNWGGGQAPSGNYGRYAYD